MIQIRQDYIDRVNILFFLAFSCFWLPKGSLTSNWPICEFVGTNWYFVEISPSSKLASTAKKNNPPKPKADSTAPRHNNHTQFLVKDCPSISVQSPNKLPSIGVIGGHTVGARRFLGTSVRKGVAHHSP